MSICCCLLVLLQCFVRYGTQAMGVKQVSGLMITILGLFLRSMTCVGVTISESFTLKTREEARVCTVLIRL